MTSEIVTTLINQHQVFLGEWMPRVEQLASSSSIQVIELVNTLKSELQQHITKEEQILFPLISEGKAKWAGSTVSTLQTEHRDHTQLFNEIESLISGDISQQPLLDILNQFNQVLSAHVELEEQILFPRALSGERIG
ncbi:MAG: hemerythrin domain-containing protein [Planctomycetes bacterium]|nr:hemerythrin domain-containing protein [Planctomycetota bacterium]